MFKISRKAAGALLAAVGVSVCLLSLKDLRAGRRDGYAAEKGTPSYQTPAPPEGTVSVNEGDAEELTRIPGIGETMAALILEERDRNGPFFYPEDLLTVRGIGPGKLEKIRPLLDLRAGGEKED